MEVVLEVVVVVVPAMLAFVALTTGSMVVATAVVVVVLVVDGQRRKEGAGRHRRWSGQPAPTKVARGRVANGPPGGKMGRAEKWIIGTDIVRGMAVEVTASGGLRRV